MTPPLLRRGVPAGRKWHLTYYGHQGTPPGWTRAVWTTLCGLAVYEDWSPRFGKDPGTCPACERKAGLR